MSSINAYFRTLEHDRHASELNLVSEMLDHGLLPLVACTHASSEHTYVAIVSVAKRARNLEASIDSFGTSEPSAWPAYRPYQKTAEHVQGYGKSQA